MVIMSKQTLSAADFGSMCVCLGVRKAARAVSRRYDEAFRPLGITSGQFSILAALLRDRPVPISSLADALGMERTTLTRNLRPLEDGELVATVADKEDRRIRGLRLTAAGHGLLERAIPLWKAQQSESQKRLAGAPWRELRAHLAALT